MGINYGLTDSIKMSVIPKVNTAAWRYPSFGFQMMRGNKILDTPLDYFVIASGSIYSDDFTKHHDAIYNRDLGGILGIGLYYQYDSGKLPFLGKLSFLGYSSGFYEYYRLSKKENLDLMYADDPQTKPIGDFGMDIGAELKVGKDSKYVLKFEYRVLSNLTESSFLMSLTVPFQFQFRSKS